MSLTKQKLQAEMERVAEAVALAEENPELVLAAPALRAALKPLAFCTRDDPPPGVAVEDWRVAVDGARVALANTRSRP